MLCNHSSRYYKLPLMAAIIIFCVNTSQDSGSSKDEEPPINCQGTIIDNQGDTIKVRSILIGGLYQRIPFYTKPASKEISPAVFTSEIDLKDIASIALATPQDPLSSIHSFNNREYVELEVVAQKSPQDAQKYLVERSRELWVWRQSAPTGKSRIKFEGIKKLMIDSCAHFSQEACKQDEAFMTKVDKMLGELKEDLYKLPDKISSTVDAIKQHSISMVNDMKKLVS